MAKIPAGIIVLWPGNNGAWPSGWAREASLDGRFPRGRTSGTAVNDGSADHNHNAAAHTHPGGAHTHTVTTNSRRYPNSNQNFTNNMVYGTWNSAPNNRRHFGPNNHTHNATSTSVTPGASGNTTPSWEDTTTDPLNYEMIAIVSDGEPAGFPDDCVVFYNSGSTPTDWTNHTASAGRFIKPPSSSSGNGGTTNNVGHGHAGTAHTHNAASGNHDHAGGNMEGSNNEGISTSSSTPQNIAWIYQVANTTNHTHSWDITSGTTGAANSASSPSSATETYVPPYHILLGIQNTSGEDNWLEEAIVLWMGNTSARPDDWTLCNGDDNTSGNATPNLDGKYVQMWASGGGSVGATGGSDGHDHSNPSAHAHPAASHTHPLGPATWTPTGAGTGDTGRTNSRTYIAGDQWGTRCSWHHHGGSNSSGPTPGNYGSTAQDVVATSNTEPLYRTVGYLSAPAEPSSGNIGMFGAAF